MCYNFQAIDVECSEPWTKSKFDKLVMVALELHMCKMRLSDAMIVHD